MAAVQEAATSPESKPRPCLQLTLVPASSTTVIESYPPQYARTVADRVLIRPCMTEAFENVGLKPLAVVEDGSTQSLLVVPTRPLWTGPVDLSSSTVKKVGYPVLPISIAEEEMPKPASAPDEAAALASSSSADNGSDGEVGIAGDSAVEAPTLWEQVELPWQMLERAGVLLIERDEDAMPTRVSLADGAAAWMGELPLSAGDGARQRTVIVRVIDSASSERLALQGSTAVPECGFCKFMKAGPCGAEFVAWEACVDVARDSGEDFVEKCGKVTLALKACTDRHPEYYGELSGGSSDPDDDDDDNVPPLT